MSDGNKNWSVLKKPPKQPKGPEKPWKPDVEKTAEQFVEFLKDSDNKGALKDFIIDTYKKFESEKISEFQARLAHEKEVDSNRIEPFHKPGNIAPAMSEHLSMNETEKSFARGLAATKKNLVLNIEDRVEEIQSLLAGIGGFSSQLKSCFARSTVVFLEQEDQNRSFRERIIFSINLPNYELKRSWKEKQKAQEEPEPEPAVPKGRKTLKAMNKKKAAPDPKEMPDNRTEIQATWDDAVNALAQIVASTGLKPKFCKNDRHYGRFVMKQDLRSSSQLPDEYFSFTLDYNTKEKIDDMIKPYNKILKKYNKKINSLARKLKWYGSDSTSKRYEKLKKLHLKATQERDFFVATTPDPNQLDEGLLFLIEVSTLKDYHIVKDRMQSIMTKYILHLSSIAVKEAAIDPDLEYEMWKMGNRTPKKSSQQKLADQQAKQEAAVADLVAQGGQVAGEGEQGQVGDLGVPEYKTSKRALRPVKKAG